MTSTLSLTPETASERSAEAQPKWFTDRTALIRDAIQHSRQQLADASQSHSIERHPTEDISASRLPGDTVRTEPRVIDLPVFMPIEHLGAGISMAAMQEWEGVVTEVHDDTVYADLIDITAGRKKADEAAEIPISEFDEADRLKLRPGIIFRWAIGYLKTEKGQRIGASVIRLRLNAPVRPASEVRIASMAVERS